MRQENATNMLSTLGRCCVVALLTMFFVETGTTVGQETNRGSFTPGPLLRSMLKGDLQEVDEIIFAVRVSGRDHWYANFGYYSCDYDARPVARAFGMYPDGVSLRAYDDGGRLCRMNLRTGELRTLFDDPAGGVRDPQMHYDGKKILFSYRRGGSPSYRLYEINIDGSGLRQLTADDGPDDDIEPVYLPDGGIMFVSSRCRRFVNCWFTRVGTLHRCDADGSNIRLVSSNNEHDNTPWVLPDGRILYMRWEYVDRSQADYHHLWTINPDGSGQMTYYGNQFVGTVMLDAKPIPGSNKIVASFSPGHGRVEHQGAVTIVDPKTGPDNAAAAKQIAKAGKRGKNGTGVKGDGNYRDPYPLSENCFLVSSAMGIHVMDGKGNQEVIYRLSPTEEHLQIHEPRLLKSRPRERIIPPRIDLCDEYGTLFLADIYHGRNMKGVERGEIKKLLVLEQLPMPLHCSGGFEAISMGGTFTLARILGTVPVEEDGSAFFEVPALRSLFFVALDENDLSVKRMQSFVTVQPGETTGCVGCHEQRTETIRATSITDLMANSRLPAQIAPIDDVPAPLDFPRDIQPILDKHCVECHNPDRYEGRVDLCGDHLPMWSISYVTLFRLGLVSDGGNKPISNRDPRTIGSSASKLLKYLDGSHHDAKLTDHERKVVRLWIDGSANWAGTYACLGNPEYQVSWGALPQRCAGCHKKKNRFKLGVNRVLCNLDRPEKSLVLKAPLSRAAGGLGLCGGNGFKSTNDPDYQKILANIRLGAKQLAEKKRFDMPGFRPNKFYIREMQRFGFLPQDLGPNDPIDPYATDEAYWQSFWWKPYREGAE